MVFQSIYFFHSIFAQTSSSTPDFFSNYFLLFRRRAERARNRRRSRILMTMLLVFVFSWLPLNIINLLEDLELEVSLSASLQFGKKWETSKVHCWRWYAFAYFSCHLVSKSNLKPNSTCSKGYPWQFASTSSKVAMASTCCNPFLYSWLNENFRFYHSP